MSKTYSKRYQKTGVDETRANEVTKIAKSKFNLRKNTVVTDEFACGLELPASIKRPVIVSSCDGVGSKTMLLTEHKRLETAGRDLVASCVNDLICCGATPWYFLDYLGCNALSVDDAEQILAGVASACQEAGCSLVGGETSQLPDMLTKGSYELVGHAVGYVGAENLLGPKLVKEGDAILGIVTDNPHCNGYSLIRDILKESNTQITDLYKEHILADLLLAPTPFYVNAVLGLIQEGIALHSVANITGGGIPKNLPRALPASLGASVDLSSFQKAVVFNWLQETGKLEEQEMLDVFNCGIGMSFVVQENESNVALDWLNSNDFKAVQIGQVTKTQGVTFA